MKGLIKKSCLLGITFCLIPAIHGIAYETDCENLFINNKTNHDLIIRFCNEYHDEQQQFPIKANEHCSVKVNVNVMKKLNDIRVSIDTSAIKKKKHHKIFKGEAAQPAEPKKQAPKEIDYERDTGIVGLEINMNPDLDLKWKHDEDYLVPVPGTEGAA